MSGHKSLAIAQLAINAVLAIPAIYLFLRNIRHHFLGWLYLLLVCVLQMTGSGLFLSNSKSAGGQILSSICLSPLLLAGLGILLQTCELPDVLHRRFTIIVSTIIHLLIVAAVGIVAAGAADLSSSHPKASDQNLVKVGILILLVSWAVIILWALLFYRQLNEGSNLKEKRPNVVRQYQNRKKIWYIIVLALLITGIRVAYTAAEAFDQAGSLNPTTQSIALQACLSALPEFLAVMLLIVAGWQVLGVGGK